MNFYKLENGNYINLDLIASIEPDSDERKVALLNTEGTTVATTDRTALQHFIKTQQEDTFGKHIENFCKAVRDFGQSVLRIPTSIRMRM